MTPAAARAAVESLLASSWSATPIAWPNVAFTPPTTVNATWLKVDWIWGNGSIQTKGTSGGRNVSVGILQLAVFGPPNLGDGTLDALAETARALFNRKRLAAPNTDVMFGAASGPVRLTEESWRSVVVSIPFKLEETVV